VRSSLGAMPYTVRLYRIIMEEHLSRFPEDNTATAHDYQREAFDHAWSIASLGAKEDGK
jgi:hypothetical protein